MQFTCNQDTFSKYLNIVSRIASVKPGLPILSNVLFETSKSKLLMTATDLEIGVHCWMGAEIKAEGKTVVPAKQLAEFVNSVPAEQMDINLDKQQFSIKTTNNEAHFNTSVADDFPKVAELSDEKPLFTLTKENVIEIVGKVAFSAAKDDIKPVLTGVKIEISGENIHFVSADGIRLSRLSYALPEQSASDIELLVPAKAFDELARIVNDLSADNEDEKVSVYLIEEKNQIIFRYCEVDLVSRLIDGQFPDYKVIIPTSYQTKCKISRSDFVNALKVVNVIARNVIGNKIFLSIDKKGDITLSAAQAEVGNNKSTFGSEIEGQEIEMAFSGRYLTDIINSLSGDEIIFECTTQVAPGVFKLVNSDNYIHLIMPMRF